MVLVHTWHTSASFQVKWAPGSNKHTNTVHCIDHSWGYGSVLFIPRWVSLCKYWWPVPSLHDTHTHTAHLSSCSVRTTALHLPALEVKQLLYVQFTIVYYVCICVCTSSTNKDCCLWGGMIKKTIHHSTIIHTLFNNSRLFLGWEGSKMKYTRQSKMIKTFIALKCAT